MAPKGRPGQRSAFICGVQKLWSWTLYPHASVVNKIPRIAFCLGRYPCEYFKFEDALHGEKNGELNQRKKDKQMFLANNVQANRPLFWQYVGI